MCKLADHHNDPTTTAAPPTDLPFIPDNDLCRKTYTFASSRLPPAILNHSHRVFLYARHIATLPLPSSFDDFAWHRRSPEHRETLLFLAAMLHDLGACDEFNGDARFEVCGADAAAGFMARNGLGGSMRDDVWTAIACHTSPGIAEGVAPLARILRLAVLCDFDRPGMRSEMGVLGMCEGVEAELPRMDKIGRAHV